MKNIEGKSKIRNRDTYHMVQIESTKLKVVVKILNALKNKKTHKYRPTCITDLAKKVSSISHEYIDPNGNSLKIGKSTLLRENGVYRPKLEAFLAQVMGSNAVVTPPGKASKEELVVQVRDLQLQLRQETQKVEVLSKRLEGCEGSVFDAIVTDNTQALQDKRHDAQTKHNLCLAIFQLWSYMDDQGINTLMFENGEIIEPFSKTVVVKRDLLMPYFDWLSK